MRAARNCIWILTGAKRVRQLVPHAYRRLNAGVTSTGALPKTTEQASAREEFPVGRRLHGFTVTTVQDIPELCLTAIRLSHDVTNADYVHLARDDGNNVFAVGFRTAPLDSTGVPHILEHTTLCGSQKYPCRDPFFKMLNRSLSTFMNAFTGSDYTMYPFSTQNMKDFENLQMVYLDAVFFPLLRELDFLQEGWRLEHEDIDDQSSPIIFKGGSLKPIIDNLDTINAIILAPRLAVKIKLFVQNADTDSIFSQHLQNKLLPSHTYSFVSGGDPLCIPQLTWNHLKQFHATHYHPSNSNYGNFPLSNHLRVVDSYLSKFVGCSPNTVIPDEKRWTKPRTEKVECHVDPLIPNPEKQTTVSVSYLLNSIVDQSEYFTTSVLGELLTSGPNSPFYKSLIEPNIGSGYSPCSGFNGSSKTTYFSVGLKGIAEKDVSQVVGLIEKAIDEVIRDGFPKERIEAVLHTIELSLKHQTSNFGLAILMGMYSSWNHDGDPIQALQVNHMMREFKSKLESNPQFLQEKVKQYFKDNVHKFTLIMTPKEDYEAERIKAEEKLLKEKLSILTERDRQTFYEQGIHLRSKQNQQDDASVLPTVRLADIDDVVHPLNLHQSSTCGVPLQICAQPTNGLTYFRAVMNTKSLTENQKKLIPLFCYVLTKMGTSITDYKTFAQKVDLNTGGLDAHPILREDATTSGIFEEGIILHSYSLDQNVDTMMSLWAELFQRVSLLNLDLLTTLVNDLASDLAVGLSSSGHSYAMTKAGSTLSCLGALKEMYGGVQQISVMRHIAESQDLNQLSLELQHLAVELLKKNHMRLSVNALPRQIEKSVSAVEKFVSVIPGSPSNAIVLSKSDEFQRKSCRQHIVLPLPVNFVSRTYPAVSFCHEDFARLKIMAILLSTKFLHKEIREKGGAYGAGALLDSSSLALYSYRDPNNLETLKTFEDGVNWVLNSELPQQDIDEAKLMAFSNFDKPIAPGNKGLNLFLNGITDEARQKHRENMFRVTRQDIKDVCYKYLKKAKIIGDVILGPKVDATMDGSWEISEDHN